MNARSTALALVAACFLWSCSSSNGFRVLPDAGSPETGALVASLTIKIPLHVASRPHWVSPSTKSAEIAIEARKGCRGCSGPLKADIGLTPSSKNCSNTAAGITCTIDVRLKPGLYKGSLTTYDGLPGCQSATVPCHTLSLKQAFPVKVVARKVSVPTIVLEGVPHSIWYLDVDNSTVVDRGNALFGLVGPNAKGRVELYSYDSDGNLILGPGAPSFTANAVGAFSASVSGNVMQLSSGPVMVAGEEALTVTAHSPGCTGAFCTLNGFTEFNPMVAVAENTLNAVGIYVSHRIEEPPYATVTSGISAPAALTFDSAGHLFVANSNATVTEYAAPYTAAPIATFTAGLHSPTALATAGDGELAVADASNDTVMVYAPPSTTPVAQIALPAAPTAIAFDPTARLWVGMSGVVERFVTPYTGSPVSVLNGSNGINQPVSIGLDSSGDIYVADAGAGAVNLYKSPYTGPASDSVAYPNVTTVLVGSRAFACGKGNLDVLAIGSLNPDETQDISDGATQLCATDQNGDLYDSDATYGDIAEYDPALYNFYTNLVEGVSQPVAMAAYP